MGLFFELSTLPLLVTQKTKSLHFCYASSFMCTVPLALLLAQHVVLRRRKRISSAPLIRWWCRLVSLQSFSCLSLHTVGQCTITDRRSLSEKRLLCVHDTISIQPFITFPTKRISITACTFNFPTGRMVENCAQTR